MKLDSFVKIVFGHSDETTTLKMNNCVFQDVKYIIFEINSNSLLVCFLFNVFI